MKKFLIILIFLSALQVTATQKQFGIGLGGGNIVSGLSGKYILGGHTALQGVVGVRGNEGFALSTDFIMEFPPYLVKNSDVTLAWYAGAGAFWWHYSYDYSKSNYSWEIFGINGVVGLSLMLQKVPLEFALEWRPAFFISTSNYDWYNGYNGLYLGGAGGAIRWYF